MSTAWLQSASKVTRYILNSHTISVCMAMDAFRVGAYLCMGAYKCNVVVVMKMGAYIHGVLILDGCLLF